MKEEGYVKTEHKRSQDVKNTTVQIFTVKYSRNKKHRMQWDKTKMNYKEVKRFTQSEVHLAPPQL